VTPDPHPRRWYGRYGGPAFLGVLVLALITAPFVAEVEGGEVVEPVGLTVMLVAAVGAVGDRRRPVVVAGLLAVPVLVGRWAHHARPDRVPAAVYLAGAVVFAGYVVAHHVRFVMRTRRVDVNALCAGVTGYLMLGLLWTFAYLLVGAAVPGSFAVGPDRRDLTGTEAAYLSFMTLSTVGYGDIVPASRPARTLAVLEATTGLFYVAVLIARLVALYSAETARGDRPP
jgi:hypothetical protein